MTSPVFLIGFMASGKTTVGRALATELALPFLDLDAEIERAAGRSVRELFAAEGEAAFRTRERAVLDAVLAGPPAVVATGGGTPCFGDALAVMRRAGRVVALDAPLPELLARVDDPGSRPLLARPAEETRALFAARRPVYRQAHFAVDTRDRTVADTVARARAGLAALDGVPVDAAADAAVVALGDRAYPVIVDTGAIDRLGALCAGRLPARCTRVGVVTDERVAPLYLDRATASLRAAGLEVATAIIPAGEASKTLAEAGRIAEAFATAGLDRRSAIVALGGGVVGDLAGFVAATLFRGVALVQVPTTLVAMIDSAIGGKTAVDLPAGKNLIGAFWQPVAVVDDPAALATLPVRERRAGLGELIKYGLLDSEELLAACERYAPAIAAGSADADAERALIRRCAAYKSWVVTLDEREQRGERAWLNLGHTIGHAIEAEAGYGALLHGECVALGLVAACRVSHALGRVDADLERRVVDLLRSAGLDADLDPWLRPEVLARVGVDKKRVGGNVSFVALAGVGAPATVELSLDELSRILRV